MPAIITFAQAIEQTQDAPRSVLLGNGFSIGQGGGNFGYSSLLERSGLPANSPIRAVFNSLGTVDFEQVMRSLEHAAVIEAAYGDNARSATFLADAGALRAALIHAVRDVHPGIQFDIPEQQLAACGSFVSKFSNVFTLNYDLLLYWVILNIEQMPHRDGFGLGRQQGAFRIFDTRAHCSTYYLHGALHLFLGEEFETKKLLKGNGNIMDRIEATILASRQLPMFIAEGTAAKKKSKIYSIPYLRNSYEALQSGTGSLFVYGHSVSAQDEHIYDAVFESGITKFVFCVYRPQDGWNHVRENFARFAERRGDIEFLYVDAASANVWG